MTLQIIGAGFGRTGTYSLKHALERLGYGPCDHMTTAFEQPGRFSLWAEALDRKHRGGAIDWNPLFADYRATVDWPGAHFWRELANAHPNAKVILTVREPQAWYDSVQRTIWRMPKAMQSSAAMQGVLTVAGAVDPRLRDAWRVIDGAIWQGTFDGRFTDREHALDVFAAHNAAVERTIAPDRLLVFDVSQGWEPLCAFLGVPVPDEPFPHLNDALEFERRVRQRIVPAAAAIAGGALLAVTALAALARGAARSGNAAGSRKAARR